MDRKPKPGEFYRHFKDRIYQVVTVAKHSETGEELVVYQAMYGTFQTYARPLAMFVSEVDREKYPHAAQTYRFELVDPMGLDGKGDDGAPPAATRAAVRPERLPKGPSDPSSWLMEFLDAQEVQERLDVLSSVKGPVEQRDLDSLYLAMDMPPQSGGWEEQLALIRGYLKTRLRFEGNRLRWGE